MAEDTPTLSVVTLSVNGLNSEVKNRNLQNGQKNMTQLYVLYKRLTYHSRTYID